MYTERGGGGGLHVSGPASNNKLVQFAEHVLERSMGADLNQVAAMQLL